MTAASGRPSATGKRVITTWRKKDASWISSQERWYPLLAEAGTWVLPRGGTAWRRCVRGHGRSQKAGTQRDATDNQERRLRDSMQPAASSTTSNIFIPTSRRPVTNW